VLELLGRLDVEPFPGESIDLFRRYLQQFLHFPGHDTEELRIHQDPRPLHPGEDGDEGRLQLPEQGD